MEESRPFLNWKVAGWDETRSVVELCTEDHVFGLQTLHCTCDHLPVRNFRHENQAKSWEILGEEQRHDESHSQFTANLLNQESKVNDGGGDRDRGSRQQTAEFESRLEILTTGNRVEVRVEDQGRINCHAVHAPEPKHDIVTNTIATRA